MISLVNMGCVDSRYVIVFLYICIYHIIKKYNILYYIVLYYIILYYIILYYIISYYFILYMIYIGLRGYLIYESPFRMV